MTNISRLNEYCQKNNLIAQYSIISKEGPSHSPLITVKLIIAENEFIAKGTNKKIAKQECAIQALSYFNINSNNEEHNEPYTIRMFSTDVDFEKIWNDEVKQFKLILKKTDNTNGDFKYKEVSLTII